MASKDLNCDRDSRTQNFRFNLFLFVSLCVRVFSNLHAAKVRSRVAFCTSLGATINQVNDFADFGLDCIKNNANKAYSVRLQTLFGSSAAIGAQFD